MDTVVTPVDMIPDVADAVVWILTDNVSPFEAAAIADLADSVGLHRDAVAIRMALLFLLDA